MQNKDLYQLTRQGVFPNFIDPWAEDARYFHQLHGHMITYLQDQIAPELFQLGFVVGRETSLQIAENRQPDVYIQTSQFIPPQAGNYSATATALHLDEGILVETEIPPLDAIFIKSRAKGDLVSVIEIISPSNKANEKLIAAYQARRSQLLERHVHIVEIDLTRSINRLITTSLAQDYPYHIMIHLHDELPRFLGMRFKEIPKAFALPLIKEGIAVDLNKVYRDAYAQTMIAWHIENEGKYQERYLPFPSMFSQDEHQDLMQAIQTWQLALKAAE